MLHGPSIPIGMHPARGFHSGDEGGIRKQVTKFYGRIRGKDWRIRPPRWKNGATTWKLRVTHYFAANGISEDKQKDTFLCCIGRHF